MSGDEGNQIESAERILEKKSSMNIGNYRVDAVFENKKQGQKNYKLDFDRNGKAILHP